MTNHKLGKMVDAKLSKWAGACALNGHPLVTFQLYGKIVTRDYCLCGYHNQVLPIHPDDPFWR